MRTPLKPIFLSFALAVAVGACTKVDDQTVVNSSDESLVNPRPSARFAAPQNQQHAILVAAIDTGIDYNHPLLQENIHFRQDRSGRITGFGHDYVGEDQWASPYLARTARYNYNLDSDKRKDARERVTSVRRLINADRSLSEWIHPRRAIEQEIQAGAYHGTHVAGLMVYDRPQIGLTGYRVLPMNERKDWETMDYNKAFFEKLSDAIDRAASDGVRVVNISLGHDAKEPVVGEKTDKYDFALETKAKFKRKVESHPNMLFVVAAGNDGRWLDNEINLTLPCSVGAPNVLCVGALGQDGRPASFTNLFINGIDMVLALGEKVLSTTPTKICSASEAGSELESFMITDGVRQALDSPDRDHIYDAVDTLEEHCGDLGLERLSGTSMAAPLVARIAAEILLDDPDLTGKEVKTRIREKAEKTEFGALDIYKLSIEKPSWYSEAGNAHHLPVDSKPEFFELYVPGVQR